MRLSYAEALEQAVRMAGQAHKRFLQTVKLLHELRRAPLLQIGHAAQVNVALQQVTIARLERDDE
jgi:hypothetical protein